MIASASYSRSKANKTTKFKKSQQPYRLTRICTAVNFKGI